MKKLFTISSLATLYVSSLFGAENYLINNTWGGGGGVDSWSLKARAADDDLIFDGTYYREYATATVWDIGYWVNTGLAAQYKNANSITIQNLHNEKGEKMNISVFVPAAAGSNLIHTSAGALTFVTDKYNSSFTWKTIEGKSLVVTLGGINMGSAESTSAEGGTLCLGGSTNVSSFRPATGLRGLTINGDINMYGNSTLKLNVGVSGEPTADNGIFSPGNATAKATGSLNMYKDANSTYAPTVILNNASTDGTAELTGARLHTVTDVAGIQGYGTITMSTGALGGNAYLVVRNTKDMQFYGTIIDDKQAGRGNGGMQVVISNGAVGTQTIGDINISKNLEIRGKLAANVTKANTMYIGGNNVVSSFEVLSANSKFGSVNVNGLIVAVNGSRLIMDIDGSQQDIVNVVGSLNVNSKTLYIDFSSLANIEQDAEYRLINYGEFAGNTTIDSFKIGNMVEGYEGNLFLRDNALWVNFTTVLPSVPEPAEWAMVLGFFALAFAIYRRRK